MEGPDHRTLGRPLGSLRVLELSSGIAGGYAGKLFADAGADVVKVEPPAGDPLRALVCSEPGAPPADGHDGALFRYLAAGKRSVVGALGDPDVQHLVAGSDVVIERELTDGALGTLLGDPGLVVISLTPYGRAGPWAGRPGNEFTAQAECGSTGSRGTADRPPVAAGGWIGEWAAGAFGAATAMVALRDGPRSAGDGAVHVDVSMAEVLSICTNLYADLMMAMLGRPTIPGPARSVEFPSIERTADGWVAFNTNSAQMLQDFLVMVGRDDLAGDPQLRSNPDKVEDLRKSTGAWCAERSTEEIIELASLLRIPVAPVGNGANLPGFEQLAARGVFVPAPDGTFLQPRPPYRITGCQIGTTAPSPSIGADTGAVEAHVRTSRTGRPGGAPLEGLRVLDLTCWWAGPAATQLLGAFGADVVHVEAVQRMDGMRAAATLPFAGTEQWWERSSFFLSINVNKRDITLDLDDPRGAALIGQLVRWADVVVDNYTPRVLERFGLDWEGVHAANPAAVMLRMPAFGLDGPWRDRPGFAQTIEAMSGLAWMTGHPDGPMLLPRGPADPIGAAHGAFALLLALQHAEATGSGVLIEAPLLESALNVAAIPVIEHSAYGQGPTRMGNRSAAAAPQGVYACRGEEQWIALSVVTDDQWQALAGALGATDLADDPALAHHAGRQRGHDHIDARITAWASQLDPDAAVSALVQAGVPAGHLVDHRRISEHPHMAARGFFETVEHPVVGAQKVFSLPLRYRGIDRFVRTPAPTLGQHNHEVLGDLLGLDDAELAKLEADHVIGTAPL